MSVELVDSGTIIGFIEDEEAFDGWTNDRFARIDTDHDGVVSCNEMMKELRNLRLLEITDLGSDVKIMDAIDVSRVYESILVQFDRKCSGIVNVEKFKEEMKGMMIAIAQNIGSIPVQMLLEQDSFLKNAVRLEKHKLT